VHDEPRSGRPAVVRRGHVLREEDTETGVLIMVETV
jgi:hypothetical protein